MAANGKPNGKNMATKKTRKLEARSPLNGRWVFLSTRSAPPSPVPEAPCAHPPCTVVANAGASNDGRSSRNAVTPLCRATSTVPAVNRAIEAELRQLETGFALSGPAQLPSSRLTPARKTSRSSSFNSSRLDLPLEKISALRSRARAGG